LKSIAINGRFLSQAVTGVQRYARELLLELDQLLVSSPASAGPVEVLAPLNAGDDPPYKSLRIRKVGRLTGQLWEQADLPRFSRGKLLFTPCGGAPILHACNVVTIPDAAVFATPLAYSRTYGTWYRTLNKYLGRSARRIITVSEFSRSELIKYCGISPQRLSVTQEGCDHMDRIDPDRSVLDQYGLTHSSYVLAVSSANPNKNFHGVVEAMRVLRDYPIRFVIAGNTNASVFGASGGMPASVIRVGHVSDAQLRALYESAGCFVFPSFYEGFGLPPLEAMVCGSPVIAANIGALRETCADAVLYCDPGNPASISASIFEIMNNGDLRSHLLERAHVHTQKFRWKDVAAETWAILQEVAADC